MSSGCVLLLAFGVGVVAGLRSLTAPAVVAWAAYLRWLNLAGSPVRFMGSVGAVALFTLLALVEFVMDQRPTTPARTAAMPLVARIVMGLLTGACFGIAGGVSAAWLAALAGAVGALVGHLAVIRRGSGWCGRSKFRILRSLFPKTWSRSDWDCY